MLTSSFKTNEAEKQTDLISTGRDCFVGTVIGFSLFEGV